MSTEVKPGKDTTEYQIAKQAGTWGIVSLILGFIVMYGPQILESVAGVVPPDSKTAIIVGAVISLAGLLLKTFTSLGYIKSRSDVKVAAENRAKAEAGG